MQRYFVAEKKDEYLFAQSNDIHHMQKVMRYKNGDQVIGLIHEKCYLCTIDSLEEGKLKIVEEMENSTELDHEVTLIYSMPKGDKFEFVLQKATELGVNRIVPLISKRTVVKLDEKSFAKKKIRYEKIIKEACEQSYRNKIPVITDYVTLKQLPAYLGDINLVAYEEEAKRGESSNLKQALSKAKPKESITIIVGCEGGFEQSEIDYMKEAGVISCSLGKRILRSETAPLYMLSVISYELELTDHE